MPHLRPSSNVSCATQDLGRAKCAEQLLLCDAAQVYFKGAVGAIVVHDINTLRTKPDTRYDRHQSRSSRNANPFRCR